jgi:hypothetical protein
MRTHTRTWRPRFEILEDRCLPSTFAAFDLDTPESGPFPSDRFTVADTSQLTNRRVNLPLPDAASRPSDYADISLINTLDGFNLQPRLSITFSGPIDVSTVSSSTVFLVKLGDATSLVDRGGQIVGINQTVWDIATNTLHVESDELLDQHTRYALIVTRGLRDADGQPVEPSDAFTRFRHDLNFGQTADPALKEYGNDLLGALSAAARAGVQQNDIVTASVFTTQSATAVLEKIRDQIHAATPAPADFLLGPEGARTVFALDEVTGITWSQQLRHSPNQFNSVSLATELAALRLTPGAVGSIAYGKYTSPEYLVHPGEFIPPVATRTGVPQITGTADVYFNLILPSGAMPEGGWPVAIYGTGQEGSKDTWLLRVAASNAAQGIATVSINYYGRGFGPSSTITVESSRGGPVTFLAGGRSVDQLGNGDFGGGFGGRIALNPMISIRDSHRQTAADWMQLVRVIQAGVDVEEDGIPDLDPSRIYYFGNSLGGLMGPLFMAVEPHVHAGVLNAFGGAQSTNTLLSSARAPNWGAFLAQRQPSLINGPGVTSIDGVPTSGPFFNENLPLRDGVPLTVRLADGTDAIIQSPVINTVPGAMAIQEVIERREWIMQAGEAIAYAPHLRKSPLAGVPAKSMIIQFAKGDTNQLNPTTSAFLRAGDLADRATFYRHDLAFAEDPTLDRNPHQFLIRVVGNPGERRIALGYQSQIAAFFAPDGNTIIHLEPARFFETPIAGPPPEALNFIVAAAAPPVRVESVVVNDGSAQRSMVNSLTITFGGVVTLYPGAFELQGHNGSAVGLNVAASVVGGRTVAVLTFRGTDIIGGSLADGSYTLAIHADWVRDASGQELDGDGDGIAGGDRTEAFFRLFGDSDGDRDVDRLDRDLFRSALGKSIGDAGYLWFFDFDGDGDVDGLDNGEFNRRFGQD